MVNTFTDIARGHVLLRRAPPALRPWLLLLRVDRPVGTVLLLAPGWWALALAGDAASHWPLFVAFAVGAALMRAAGCVANDLADRRLDARTARAAGRPLAAGLIAPPAAALLLVALLAAAAVVVLTMNALTVALALLIVPFVLLYPFAKRFTVLPQLALGLVFNWGALMGWAAATGSLPWPAFALYAAGVLFTIAYDAIYARMDCDDDRALGLGSAALLFAGRLKIVCAALHAGFLVLLATAALGGGAAPWIIAWLAAAAVWLTVIVRRLRPESPQSCLTAFRAHQRPALLLVAALLLS